MSKVVRGPALQSVRPYEWMQTGSAPSAEQPLSPPAQAESTLTATLLEDQLAGLRLRLAESESAAERRIKEVRETAYREGETSGRNAAAGEVRATVEKLARSIQELAELRPRLREQAEADVVKLALAIARRVVHRELNTDPDSIVGLVKVALDKLRRQEAVRVRVHPTHQSIVKEFLSHIAGCAHVEVTGDATASLGGVVFETSRGEFDVSAEVQFKEIEKGLTDRLTS